MAIKNLQEKRANQNLRNNRKFSKYVKLTATNKRELARAFLKEWVRLGSQVKAVYSLRNMGFKTKHGTPYSNPTLQSHLRRWIVYDPVDAEYCFTNPEFCGLDMSHENFERMRVENAFALFRPNRKNIWIWADTFGLKSKYFDALDAYVKEGYEDDFSIPPEDANGQSVDE